MRSPLLFKFRLTILFSFICAINAFSQLNVHAYEEEARKEMDNKNYFEAIQKLDVCIEVRPNEYVAYFYRGVCKYYLNDNLGAELDLNSAMSAYNPLLYDTYHYRSLVKYRLEDFEGAIKDIDHVIKEAGNDPLLYVERGFFKLSDQNFNGAVSDCNTALRMHYAGENVYLCRGMAENALTKYDSALINYNIALKLNPKDIDVPVRIGVTDYNLEKYKEAIAEYTQALKIDSTYTLAYYKRAEAKIKLEDDEGAIYDFTMVVSYDPMNALAYYNRAALEGNKNEYKNAIADFDKVLTLSPKNIEALMNRAKLKSQTKDYRGALADYNTTIELYPNLVEAYYERAQIKENLKDHTGAREDYKMGKYMSDLSRFSDTLQRAKDSTKLMRLMALNADFNSSAQKLSDTANTDLRPLFYIKVSSGNHEKTDCTALFFAKSKKVYPHFCLTNKNPLPENNPGESPQVTVKDSTKQPEGLLQKAISETNMQLFNAAITDYNKVITQDTGSAIAYFARGIDICKETEILGQLNQTEPDIYVNKTYRIVNNPTTDKYQKSLADFTKAIQLEPDFAFAYYNRAYVKYKLNDFRGAVDDYNYAIRINPDFTDAYYNRGLLLFCLYDKIDACEDFSKAGELGLTEAYLVIKKYCDQIK
jgi:tetratricopeptide (TPR) repeat protein